MLKISDYKCFVNLCPFLQSNTVDGNMILESGYCTWSPDTSLSSWISKSPVLVMEEIGKSSAFGIFSGSIFYYTSSTLTYFQFTPLNYYKNMLWIHVSLNYTELRYIPST